MRNGKREVVVVTGASAGAGRATVRRFARDGARIALLARGVDRLEAAAREVEVAGGEALVLPTDVADADAVQDAARQTEERFGPIDVWVNNAMTSVLARTQNVKPEEFRRVTEVNYLGFVHGTLAALERMLPRDRGTIVQVGSALAYRGIPLQSAYCGSKHAIQGFTESLRSELIHDGSSVRVNTVHMPALNTPQFDWVRTRLDRRPQPVPPIFQPEVAADAIHWAAHHDRPILFVGWPTVKTVLGQRVSSRFLDYYLAHNGFESQQTDEPEDPDRPDNLFEPAPGDYAAHGRFGNRSRDHSAQLWATKHRWLLAAVGAVAAAAAGVLAAHEED
jgi:NAD(P)-dependent dehydrogenase (short-subunit alcohol dehydrogenase family)